MRQVVIDTNCLVQILYLCTVHTDLYGMLFLMGSTSYVCQMRF